jgi:hypothetical protein
LCPFEIFKVGPEGFFGVGEELILACRKIPHHVSDRYTMCNMLKYRIKRCVCPINPQSAAAGSLLVTSCIFVAFNIKPLFYFIGINIAER